MQARTWMKTMTAQAAWMPILAAFLSVLIAVPANAASDVPAVVTTAARNVAAPGLPTSEAYIALDGCGNIYTIENYNGTVSEIPAGGGAPITILGNSGVNYDPDSLWIDAAKANLYVTWGPYNDYRIPISNCAPQPGSKTSISIGNLGAISYYYSTSAIAADTAGNIFIATNAACCAPANELLEENSDDSTGTTLLTSLSAPITAITVDASENIYFVAGGGLFELPYNTSSKAYATTPVSFGSGYKTVVGVSLDGAGNLYVADSGNSAIYEIPFETSGSSGALSPVDQFFVATGISEINTSPAFDLSGNLYYTDNSATVHELTRGNLNFGSALVSTAASATLNVVFNQPVTPSTIRFVGENGVFTPAASAGTCAAGTSYTAGNSCTINAQFTPSVPGTASAGLVLSDSSGAAISTTSLTGTGVGAGMTADPGTAASIGGGFKTPASTALDAAGDLYIADPGASTIWEISAASTTPASVGNGLNAPVGVAVDGAGNLFIADTGNNRIAEVPVISGQLSNSAQFDVVPSGTAIAGSALADPSGISVDAQGNLYIADTGNNRVIFLPHGEEWNLASATTLGSGLSAPLAAAISPSGPIYIADSGNGRILSIPYPSAIAPQTVVATGYKQPSALAVDAAGDLFLVDEGHFAVLRIPNIAGALSPTSAFNLTDGIANPYGFALDAFGNAYVTDNVNGAAYSISRTSAVQSFGEWNPGSTSDPHSFLIEDSGNASLIFGSPAYTTTGNVADFSTFTSEKGACTNGETLASGADCILTATFAPAALGAYSETLAFKSNAANLSSPQVTYSGSGAVTLPTTTTFSISSPSGSPYYGEAIAILATVTTSMGTPSGTVQLLVDGLPSTRSTLGANGSATLSLPNGLTGGSHTLQASYEGAVVGFTSYSASLSALQNIAVTRVPTATTLALSTLYTNPVSQPAGAALTMTANVSSTYAGSPTGSIVFVIKGATGGTVSQTVPLVSTSSGFQAIYTYTPPAPVTGTTFDAVSVLATYSGDTNFTSSEGGAFFDIAPATGAVATTASGASIDSSSKGDSSITFTSTSYGGWQGVVGYQCVSSTLPANAICVFAPGQVSVMASTATAPYPPFTSSLRVLVNNPPNSPVQSSTFWWIAAVLASGFFLQRRRLARAGFWPSLLLVTAIAASLAAIGGLSGCSKGASFVTPSGSSTITVVASSDPYSSGNVGSITQPCGTNASGNTDPTVAPCSQTTFNVTLNVQ